MSFDFEVNPKDLGPGYTSSKVVKQDDLPMKVKKPKYLLSSDVFRALVQRISPDDPLFTPDTFQIIEWWCVSNTPPIKDIKEVLEAISEGNNIIEFRIGTYTLESVWTRKKK